MRPQKVSDEELLETLTKIFRTWGYEGASLAILSDLSGLKKASLYHRFPNGKQEMAQAVLEHMDEWVKENIFSVMNKSKSSPEVRLQKAVSEISILYGEGNEACVFRVFSMQSGLDLFQENIKSGLKQWLDCFMQFGQSLGLTNSEAEEKANQTLIDIQGSLIISKGLDDTGIFLKTLENIKYRYFPN